MATTFETDPGQLFIGGQWREAADGSRMDVIDPSTGQVVVTSRTGEFISGWKMNYTQLQHVIHTGQLGGH